MKQNLERIKIFLIKNYKWILLFICIISLLILIKNVMNKDIEIFDEKGYAIVSKYLISDTITPFAKFITNFANPYLLVSLAILLFIFVKNKKVGAIIAINLGLSAILNLVLKHILRRSRPPIEHRIIYEKGYSLPSGHSMVSMAFYGLLIYFIYQNVKNKFLKITLMISISILIISIGISRIYLGVHYISDVIAGFLFAITYLILYLHIIENIKKDKLL